MEHDPWNDEANPRPWLSTGAIEWLNENLTSDMVGVEYGAGSSTIWFAKRLRKLFIGCMPRSGIKKLEHSLEKLNVS